MLPAGYVNRRIMNIKRRFPFAGNDRQRISAAVLPSPSDFRALHVPTSLPRPPVRALNFQLHLYEVARRLGVRKQKTRSAGGVQN